MAERIYILTGATGLLGANILRQLIDKGERVRALVSANSPAVASMPEATELVVGNLLDLDSLEELFTVPEGLELIVIHSAAMVAMDPRPDENVYAVNVTGTQNMIDKCIEKQVKKFVYISSTGAIPELPHGEEICEVDYHDPDLVVGYYSQTKAMAANLVIDAVRESGLDASIVYPSGIFGPNDYRFGLITNALKTIAQGKMRVAVEGSFNSADVRDLAAGIITCSLEGKKGEGYIMAGATYSLQQMIDIISQEMKTKGSFFTIPLWLIRPFGRLGLIYSNLTGKPPVFSTFTIYNLERNNDFSSAKAERELGYKSRPLDETLIDTVNWLKEIGEV